MRRWLTRIGLVAGLAVLAGAGLIAWPLVWPADPDATVRTVAGRQVGEATGHVVSLDAEAGVLKISSSVLGLRPIALAVDAATPIMVRDKQGGLGDLAVDVPVRVEYELEGQTRRARSVELVVAESDARVGVPAGVFSAPASAASAPMSVEPPLRPAPAIDLLPKRPPLMPAPARSSPMATPSRKLVERPAAAPASTRPPIDDEKAIEAAAARRVPSAPRSTDDGGSTDGTAAIDWLLRSRER